MKKTLALLIMMSMFLMACDSGDNDSDSANEESEETISITFIHDATEDHPQGIGADLFKEKVEERLDGSVEVELYPNSSLFDIAEGLDALQAGNIQMLSGPSAALTGIDPAFQIYSMPFLFENRDQLREFAESDRGAELVSKVESNNLKILSTWFGSFQQMTNNSHSIEEPDDLQGLRMRVMAGGLLEDQYTTLGASATVLPYSELYMALQQGTVDGQENSVTEIYTANLYEVQDYLSITNHAPSSWPLVTNLEFWEELPGEVKSELEEIIDEVEEEVAEVINETEERDLEGLQDEEIEITELDGEELREFQDTLEPLYEQYEDEIGTEILNTALEIE